MQVCPICLAFLIIIICCLLEFSFLITPHAVEAIFFQIIMPKISVGKSWVDRPWDQRLIDERDANLCYLCTRQIRWHYPEKKSVYSRVCKKITKRARILFQNFSYGLYNTLESSKYVKRNYFHSNYQNFDKKLLSEPLRFMDDNMDEKRPTDLYKKYTNLRNARKWISVKIEAYVHLAEQDVIFW